MTKTARILLLSATLLVMGVLAGSTDTAAKGPAPKLRSSRSTPKVLSPSKFVGQAALGYTAAQQICELLPNLFCYCGCDLNYKHTSLLDCFTCDHSADCPPCVDEALLAARMKREGKGIAEIEKAIDKKFAPGYPYEKPTLALARYQARAAAIQANTAGATRSDSSKHRQTSGKAPAPAPAPASASAEKPKLKPGAKAGNCCGGGKKVH